MIADRIRQARLAAGLTLDALGKAVGVSHAAIQKYEKGQTTPSSLQLLKIARACGLRTEYFFRSHTVDLQQPEFRKLATFGKKAQEALKLKVIELVEQRVELLSAFPESPLLMFAPPAGLPARIGAMDEIEAFADQVRNAWKLGMNPISDLTDTLEGLGVLVIVVDEVHTGFSGLTARARTEDGRDYPVVAVSKRWPGDRQRFTLAHELGHLLLDGRLAADLDMEQACNRFAGAFLAPQLAVLQSLGAQRHALEWQEIYGLKREFGLSMAGWLHRAKQCGVIAEATYQTMIKRMSANGWRKTEPGQPLPEESPRLFEQLVYRALAEQYISEGKAAELLGVPMMRFHKERRLELSMRLLISDANILIDMEAAALLKTLFRLPMRFGIPDVLYYEEIEPGTPDLDALGLQIMEISGDFVRYAERLPSQYNHTLPAKCGPKPSHNDYLALALAKQESCTLLTGDANLRQVARQEQIEVMGTIGLLCAMVENQQLTVDEALVALNKMQEALRRLPWAEAQKRLEALR